MTIELLKKLRGEGKNTYKEYIFHFRVRLEQGYILSLYEIVS
jgi:hypothetical protein